MPFYTNNSGWAGIKRPEKRQEKAINSDLMGALVVLAAHHYNDSKPVNADAPLVPKKVIGGTAR